MHIQDPTQKRWIQQRIEGRDQDAPASPREGKSAILRQLIEAEGFEKFLQRRNISAPSASAWMAARALIPALEQIIETRRPIWASRKSSSACRIAAA